MTRPAFRGGNNYILMQAYLILNGYPHGYRGDLLSSMCRPILRPHFRLKMVVIRTSALPVQNLLV